MNPPLPPQQAETLVFPWPSAQARRREARIRAALTGGEVMCYPTETAYALGGNALLPQVARAVYALKGRGGEKALPLLIDGAVGLEGWARDVPPHARTLVQRFWPGPLTLVFRAGTRLPDHLPDARGTVALRWSAHPLIAALLRLGGAPLIGTSANPSGRPAPFSVGDVLAAIPAGISLTLDGGALPPGLPSTLVDTTLTPFRLLREGTLPAADIRSALPDGALGGDGG